MPLPSNIHDLLTGHVFEWDRLEFKQCWNSLGAVLAIADSPDLLATIKAEGSV